MIEYKFNLPLIPRNKCSWSVSEKLHSPFNLCLQIETLLRGTKATALWNVGKHNMHVLFFYHYTPLKAPCRPTAGSSLISKPFRFPRKLRVYAWPPGGTVLTGGIEASALSPASFSHKLSIIIWPPCGTVLTGGTEGSALSSKPLLFFHKLCINICMTTRWYCAD